MADKIVTVRPTGFSADVPAVEIAGRQWVNTAPKNAPILPAAYCPCAKVLDCGAYVDLNPWYRIRVMRALREHPECSYE